MEVIKTKAQYLNLEIVQGNPDDVSKMNINELAGAYFQSPDNLGILHDFGNTIQILNENKVITVLGSDLMNFCVHKNAQVQGFQLCVGSA